VQRHVYFASNASRIKVGIARNVQARLRAIGRHLPEPIELLGSVPGSFELERAIHRRLGEHRINHEWFRDCLSVRALIKRILEGGGLDVENAPDGRDLPADHQWFSEAARELHPNKPGTHLYFLTCLGDERSCQRYAAGTVKPPSDFLRALLRSDHGSQWLAAVMAGSDAQWWRSYQEAVSLKAAVDAHRK
jgi:hypothetical protein